MSTLRLQAVLGLDGRGFQSGLSKADSAAKRFGLHTIGGLKSQLAGAFTIGAVSGLAKGIVREAGKIADAASRLSISAEAVQKLTHAFEESGGSVEVFEKAIKDLAKNRVKALAKDSSSAAKGFRALGIEAEDIKKLRLEDLFLKVADAYRDAKDPQAMMVHMMNVLGSKSTALFPAMRSDVRGLTEEVEGLGMVISNKAIAAMDNAGDAWERNMKRMKASTGELLGSIIETFNQSYILSDMMDLARQRADEKGKDTFLGRMTEEEWQAHFQTERNKKIDFYTGNPSGKYGLRPDGTKKGSGFLGPLKRPDGGVSTELSVGVGIDGEEMDIPTLVPTLTQEEIQHLLSDGEPTEEIMQKAIQHAMKRMKSGKSPFYQDGESDHPIEKPEDSDALKKVNNLNERASEIERDNKLKALSVQERRLAIEKEISELEKRQADASYRSDILGNSGDPLRAAENRLKSAELRAELLAIPDEKKPASKKQDIPTDSLVRVGNFLGASGASVGGIQQRQLEVQKQMAKSLKVIEKQKQGGSSLSENSPA